MFLVPQNIFFQRRCWEITISLFVDVALRAASILNKCVFLYMLYVLQVSKQFIWLDLSIKSMLELLILKHAVECTSQRLKWTSGARVMIIFDRFTDKLSFSLYLSVGSVLELLVVLKNTS